jgi:hypothetical protein
MCGDAVRPDYVLNATVFARDDWIELIHPEDCEDNEGWARVALRRITDSGDRQW